MRPYGAGLPDEEWQVRAVSGMAAVKTYRCPGCDHEVPIGQPHVVAWLELDGGDRRHWHTTCWRAALRHQR